jgi:hypothetical protein
LAACVQLALLLWAARAHILQASHCEVCDTFYYYNAARDVASDGLLFKNPYDGYRSYFAPLVIAVVTKLASAAGFDGPPVVRYAYGISILFWLVSVGLMIWLARRVSAKTFALVAVATLLNPFLIVYVPFALQEGVLMACCLPLLFLWVATKDRDAGRRAALVLAMALLAYIIRAALVWWLLPAAAYAGWQLWTRRRHGRTWLTWMAAVIIGGIAILGPQIYISKQHANSFNPYPSTTVFSQQIPIGITLLKFATVEDEGHWRGLTYWSPYVADPEEEKTADFYLRNPAHGAFLLLTHAYAGFHYDQLKPYWQLARARPFTIWLALSSAIVFLGVMRMAVIVATGQLDADRAFAIGTLILCVGSLVFVATESRFGIVGFAMLSITVAEWLGGRPARAEWRWLAPGLVVYLVLSFFYNAQLLRSADIHPSAAIGGGTASTVAARVPLYWLYNAAETDSTYTVSPERRDRLVRERGYADMGPIGYVDAVAQPRSRPLICFAIGAPKTDTSCTTSELEQKIARALGYDETGVEGYIPSERVAGTLVLYRVSRAYGEGNRDREHRFVVDPDELERLRKLGWTYDGSKGFVYRVP